MESQEAQRGEASVGERPGFQAGDSTNEEETSEYTVG